jgi:hypothetical protein
MASNTNELDINSMVSIETVEKKQKKQAKKQAKVCKEELLKDLNTTFLERRHITELETNKSYRVEGVERVTTKYGDAIIATLDDGGGRFKVFLPKRYTTKFTDRCIENVNEMTIQLKYIGGKYNELEFY